LPALKTRVFPNGNEFFYTFFYTLKKWKANLTPFQKKKTSYLNNRKPSSAFMLQITSTLNPQEIQLCLVLHCLIEELAILMEQVRVLDGPHQNHLQIILP
jgi:hypothetical protein